MQTLIDIADSPSLFLEGPAGAGKTTRAIERIKSLVEEGVSPDRILLLTPQRSYTLAYEEAFDQATWYALGKATVGGLARRYVGLFWPLVLAHSGYPFSKFIQPTFLTYEVAQYFMARLVSPLIEEGYFADLPLTRPRLYSQLLDNLNKAATNGISHEELEPYLKAANIGEQPPVDRVKDIVQTVEAYRTFCIEHNLLDFSLYLELFRMMMSEIQPARDHLFSQYQHLIYDNSEEDFPMAHAFVRDWIDDPSAPLESALVVYDRNAGYRRFLAANPQSALTLKEVCLEPLELVAPASMPESLQDLEKALVHAIYEKPMDAPPVFSGADPQYFIHSDRLHHQMIQRVVGQVAYLVQEGAAPEDIAIISPFLSDSMHYALATGLEIEGIAHYVHRPSRTLRDEPVTKVLLTLAMLAHPGWQMSRPSLEAITHMLHRVLSGADLVRASLLAASVDEGVQVGTGLKPFEEINGAAAERIGYALGEVYEGLRKWLKQYTEGSVLPIDHFFSKLFGEVLSQQGFGFYQDREIGGQVGRVVESAQKFRQAVTLVMGEEDGAAGKAYVQMVQEGVVSAFYALDWADMPDAVLIAPVHTFLLRNQPCAHQLWLDVGSTSWHKRIHQPLTNPYVLSIDWKPEVPWSYDWENKFEQERLAGLVAGLLRRCTESATLYHSELSAHGQEQTGELLEVLGEARRMLSNSQ